MGYTAFRSHMRLHENYGQLKLPLRCMQSNCTSYFSTLSNFLRHLLTFHPYVKLEQICTRSAYGNLFTNQSLDNSTISSSNAFEEQRHGEVGSLVQFNPVQVLQQEAACLVASLRAHSVPFCIIPEILQSCQQMINLAVKTVQADISARLPAATVAEFAKEIEASCAQPAEQLNFLGTRYKQDSYFAKHPSFVIPEECVIGMRQEFVSGENRIVYDTFQYVSIERNLNALLHNESYMGMLLSCMEQRSEDGVLRTIFDGETFQTMFNTCSEFTILIQLFFDGMGTTNPLRGQSSLCNMGVFYYVIKNLDDRLNSCHANVHLLSLCYYQDLKVHGYNSVLDKFVAEINKLATQGFEGDFPILGKKRVFVKLFQVVCDNLALNSLFGFIECFAWDYFCTMCISKQEDIQKHFDESRFEKRTVTSYNQDIEKLHKNCLEPGKAHSRGIKKDCQLNAIDGFHIMQNYALDPMHILLEGIVPLEIGCVLHYFITVKRIFSLADLNKLLTNFFKKNAVDKKNKPPELNTVEQPGSGLSPSMKSVQSWTLLKFLPIVVGEIVECKLGIANEHWLFLLHLAHLVDLIFSPSFTDGMIRYLQSVISDHMQKFKELFGSNVRLRAKHHLLVHIPTVIRKSGPVGGMCCLRYELKNSFFKRSASIMSNFTNISKTLAYRHQCFALFSLLSGAHIRKYLLPGKTFSACLSNTAYCSAVLGACSCEATDNVVITTKMHMASVEYKAGFAIIIDEEHDMPLFGKICCFMSVKDDEWVIVVQKMETITFEGHVHAYVVRYCQPVCFYVTFFHKLKDHHPLYCHETKVGGSICLLIRLPYHIML